MGDARALEVTLNYVSASSPAPVVYLTNPPDAPARESIEVRTLAFFE